MYPANHAFIHDAGSVIPVAGRRITVNIVPVIWLKDCKMEENGWTKGRTGMIFISPFVRGI